MGRERLQMEGESERGKKGEREGIKIEGERE